MQLKVLAFAQARDRLGWSERVADAVPDETPRTVLRRLGAESEAAISRAAIDYEYRDWDTPLGDARELAIIPPVSGG